MLKISQIAIIYIVVFIKDHIDPNICDIYLHYNVNKYSKKSNMHDKGGHFIRNTP